ncbi:DNA mismatch repair protein MutL [Cladophialophora carrionii]|uniref:DNA mismatch repair protein MutL n=1 Tax=Cladophialophora carrionii TaxID=86049 RepID=A0A1C1CKC1_9EURO|nr:DNA mismatch repair protein MutL [Cladophialophora carrionii]
MSETAGIQRQFIFFKSRRVESGALRELNFTSLSPLQVSSVHVDGIPNGCTMPIEALSEDTTRALGSSLVLNDAKSVVKELIDNALDAQATAISIEISANTLDVIQVKDDGTGIHVEDRQLLCKRGCTSKIRTIEDLSRLGGALLGFRGEALASIVELSQFVTVTTRVDGEVVGTSIKYAASGMISSSSASHAVGTTIRVQDFLMRIPVRKQSALKASTKTLEAIKSLLFAFAFARPEVRFSLKVPKAKNNKLNWTYAATPNQSLTETTTKIVGKELASVCAHHTITSDDCRATVGTDWAISAMLISASADPVKIRNTTQYIFVDGRPVNTERQTMKEIAKSYKRHVQNSVLSATGVSVQRPFLCMQIRCPPESYDVNVDPAKDEVLFLDLRSAQLLSLVESLFSRAYPKPGNRGEGAENSAIHKSTASPCGTFGFDKNTLRLSRADAEKRDAVNNEAEQEPLSSEDSPLPGSSMRNPFVIAAMNAKIKPVKMGSNQASGLSSMSGSATSDNPDEEALSTPHPGDCSPGETPESHRQCSGHTTPSTSPRPGPPVRRRVNTTTRIDDEEAVSPDSHVDHRVATPQQTGLQSWLTPNAALPPLIRLGEASTNMQRPSSSVDNTTLPDMTAPAYDGIRLSSQVGRRLRPGQKPFKIPSKSKRQGQVSEGLPPTPPSSLHGQHRRSQQGRSPSHFIGSKPGEHGSMSLFSNQQLRHRTSTMSPGNSPLSELSQYDTELNDIMDFEHRKKAAIAHQRIQTARSLSISIRNTLGCSSQPESIGASTDAVEKEPMFGDSGAKFGSKEDGSMKQSNPDPLRNHYKKPIKNLSHSHPDEESETLLDPGEHWASLAMSAGTAACERPVLSHDDPRAYMMRQPPKQLRGKLHRTKSTKLPLESMLPGTETFGLALTTNVFDSLQDISKHVLRLAFFDSYIKYGKVGCTDLDSADPSTLRDWEYSIHSLIDRRDSPRTQKEKDMIANTKFTTSVSSREAEEAT